MLWDRIQSQMPPDASLQLERMDVFWKNYRQNYQEVAKVINRSKNQNLGDRDFDVIVCGGTLGIFIAAALQGLGWRVIVVEQGILRGRAQEWNISRRELSSLVELGLLTASQLETAIATIYNPARVGFRGGKDLWVRDILNIGVDPIYLLATLKQKFLADGGKILEQTKFNSATVYDDGVEVEVRSHNALSTAKITGRLLLDVMGHFSLIARQGRSLTQPSLKPEGVCMVVGSCAKGMPNREYGDLIYSFTPIQNQCQYFWEAFPARDGRTTYMFTYVDADPSRPSFAQLMADYLRWLPEYQAVELEKLQFVRMLMGFFPAYANNPLAIAWDRVMQVGDSAGMQSPLSFGGFGAMVRHLQRLTQGLDQALQGDWLTRRDLQELQPYQPNLAVTWLFQKSMSVSVNSVDSSLNSQDRINNLLNVTFDCMAKLGDRVIYPFLQDVVQFLPLTQTMLAMAIADPVLVLKIVREVGLFTLLDWFKHYLGLGYYSLLYQVGLQIFVTGDYLLPEQKYYWQRQLERWQYGSGGDFATGDRPK